MIRRVQLSLRDLHILLCALEGKELPLYSEVAHSDYKHLVARLEAAHLKTIKEDDKEHNS